eukprot:scaffold354393_cov43-Prasinocladus_malaysianus.AAC.2
MRAFQQARGPGADCELRRPYTLHPTPYTLRVLRVRCNGTWDMGRLWFVVYRTGNPYTGTVRPS